MCYEEVGHVPFNHYQKKKTKRTTQHCGENFCKVQSTEVVVSPLFKKPDTV